MERRHADRTIVVIASIVVVVEGYHEGPKYEKANAEKG